MEAKNQTVAELIADLQNQLDKANNRIEGLVKVNHELQNRLNTQALNTMHLRKKYEKLKESNMELKNDLYTLNEDSAAVKKLTIENDKLKNRIDNLIDRIALYHEENNLLGKALIKEKKKHAKATEKISILRKRIGSMSTDILDTLDEEEPYAYKAYRIRKIINE